MLRATVLSGAVNKGISDLLGIIINLTFTAIASQVHQ